MENPLDYKDVGANVASITNAVVAHTQSPLWRTHCGQMRYIAVARGCVPLHGSHDSVGRLAVKTT
jgi:hypothetical protein